MKFYTREAHVRQKEEGGFIERRRETDVGQTIGKICVLINVFWAPVPELKDVLAS